MLKVFISQPMNGRTNEEIMTARTCAIDDIRNKIGDDFELLNNIFDDYPTDADGNCTDDTKIAAPEYIPIKYLAKSIDVLAEANIVYFTWDYYIARGCRVEHEVARRYGKVVVVQDDPIAAKPITIGTSAFNRPPETDSEKE